MFQQGNLGICTVKDCGPLDVPSHGQVNLGTGTTTFNSLAYYSCDSCSIIDGVSTRVCGSDGQWSPPAPTCEGTERLYNYVLNEIHDYSD